MLFPLGAALAWMGVLPWLFFALKLERAWLPLTGILGYRAFLHPLSELEGFLLCFATGLLFTLLPRSTGTAPPSRFQVLAAVAAPVASLVATALGLWEEGQAATVLMLILALEFTLRRVRPSANALWIPFGLLLGVAGAGLAFATRGAEGLWLRELGRDLVLQGMFSAMAIGAARMLRGDTPKKGDAALHALAAAAFAASFWVGARFGQHLGFALRALACIALARPLVPDWEFGPPNLRRAFAHLALWLLPLGNAWAGIALGVRRAGLHVIFLGCFAALLMAAFTQARGGARLLAVITALIALSMMARAMVELDPGSYHLWMGISSASFLIATAACAVLSLRLPPLAQSV